MAMHLGQFMVISLAKNVTALFRSALPRAGLFTATTLSRPWNSVATTAWLGLALAASYAFYAVFASPSQDKLSGI